MPNYFAIAHHAEWQKKQIEFSIYSNEQALAEHTRIRLREKEMEREDDTRTAALVKNLQATRRDVKRNLLSRTFEAVFSEEERALRLHKRIHDDREKVQQIERDIDTLLHERITILKRLLTLVNEQLAWCQQGIRGYPNAAAKIWELNKEKERQFIILDSLHENFKFYELKASESLRDIYNADLKLRKLIAQIKNDERFVREAA